MSESRIKKTVFSFYVKIPILTIIVFSDRKSGLIVKDEIFISESFI